MASNNFKERYLALRAQREDTPAPLAMVSGQRGDTAGLSLPKPAQGAGAQDAGISGAKGASAGKDEGDFASRYLALRAQRGDLPVIRQTSTVENLPGLSLPEITGKKKEEAVKADAEAEISPLMPSWAQGIADRYNPENNRDIRKNPVAEAEEKRKAQTAREQDGTTAWQRAKDMLSGAAKTYGGSLVNTAGSLMDLTQERMDVEAQLGLEAVRKRYDRAKQAYEEAEAAVRAHPGDEKWQKDLEASRDALEKAEAWLKMYSAEQQVRRYTAAATYEAADRLAESGQRDVERAKEGLGALGRFGVDVGVGGLQLGADILGGIATGGGTMLPLLLRSYGGGAQEARQEGASAGQAAAFGAASALTEALTEKISSLGNFQTKAFGSGALDDILEGAVAAVERLGKTETGRALPWAARWAA